MFGIPTLMSNWPISSSVGIWITRRAGVGFPESIESNRVKPNIKCNAPHKNKAATAPATTNVDSDCIVLSRMGVLVAVPLWKWVGEGVLVHFLLLCISGNDKKSINGSWWWRGGGRDVGRRSLHTAQIEKGNFVWSRHLYAPCYISIPVPSSASYQCWLRLNSLLGLSCCALSLLLCFSLAYLLFACWVLLLLCFICYLLFVAGVFYFYVAARFIYTHP